MTIIQVTEDDIRNGVRRTARDCPIALAVRRTLFPDYVCVGQEQIRIDTKLYWLNPEAHNFVLDFDEGKPVKPISFDIDSLEEVE